MATAGSVRQHLGGEIVSLADYRRRYALYKSDPDLQAAHAIAPWEVRAVMMAWMAVRTPSTCNDSATSPNHSKLTMSIIGEG